MRWVEIITVRSPGHIDTEFVDGLLKEVRHSDTSKHLEIRTGEPA
jgi:hypothetical protein